MGRVLAATKRLALGAPNTIRSQAAASFGRKLFPFLYPRNHSGVLYTREGDYCYIPSVQSAHTLIYAETVSLALIAIGVLVSFVLVVMVIFSTTILVVLTTLVSVFYSLFMVFKLSVVIRSFRHPMLAYTPEEIAQVTDEELPRFTVLVPLRDEAMVIGQIVRAMNALEYPRDKIEILVTVEEYDTATREALARANLPNFWRVIILPDTQPKTKPKALNVAFKEVTGEFLVIYDAEIVPDRDQLKKAYLAFRDHPELACLQTRLDHYNHSQNLLTKLFNTEFSFQYDLFLPGLKSLDAPVPLSGHSTHFRTEAVRRVGAWDPYNVAEDCEMGIRLYRAGYRVGFLNSVSREEAASTLSSWVKQRTRWMKGFIQTSIVHLRYPGELVRDMGSVSRVLMFLALVPGTVALNILNFISFFLLIIWLLVGPEALREAYPLSVLYIANVAAIIGGFTFMYLNLIALYHRGRFSLIRWWFLTPFYWFLLSWATVRALWQLRSQKEAHRWEKTAHGTHLPSPQSL